MTRTDWELHEPKDGLTKEDEEVIFQMLEKMKKEPDKKNRNINET